MYANRFADGPRFRPAGLAAALAINAGVVAALLLASPEFRRVLPKPPLAIDFIPLPTATPAPQPSHTATLRQPVAHPTAPPETIDRSVQVDDHQEVVTGGGGAPAGTADPGPATDPGPAPTVEPAFITASIDPRYAGDFQPEYPDTERDLGREDIVKLRILIGSDGRVKRVDRLAGGGAFYRAASRQALAHWRFRPATRGGIPEESWKVMDVRFRLD